MISRFSSRRFRRAVGFIFLLPVFASSLAAQEVVLERYYVNASRPAGGAPVSVSSAELRPHLPIDVGALLGRELSSVTSVRRGGVASDVLVRGLGRDNIAVLLDGAPAYAACPGRMDPPVFHVSTPLVERIVVRAGPFDVRDGAAPGGAISVTSAAPPAEPFLAAGVLAGDDALWSGDFAAGGPLGRRWRGLLGASYQQGLSYRDGDGRRQTELPGLNYQPAARDERAFAIRHAELHATWNSTAGGVLALHAAGNDARQVLYPTLLMDAQRDRSSRLGLSWSAPSARPLADRWRIAMHHERVEHDMSDALRTSSVGAWSARGYMMRTIAATTGADFSAEAEVSRPAADFVYGGQLTHRNWIADNVVGPNSNRMLPDATTRQAGVFVQAERVAGAWKLKTGARLDAWWTHAARDIAFVQAAHGTHANARCDAAPSGFALVERRWGEAAIYAGLGHGARVPDPQERYIAVDRPGTGTDWVGNPALDVVRATEVTVGTHVHAGPGRLAARVFHSWLENYIVLQRLAPAAGSGANTSRTESYGGIAADLTGAEIQADVTWAERWTLTMSAAGQRGQKRISSAAGSDRDLPEIPPWRGRATLRWSQPAGWIEAELQWALRQNHLDADAGERPLPGYGVLHLRAERAFSKTFTVSLGMENLFDRTYATHNAYTRDPFAAGLVVNEPGRSAYAQVRWRF